MYVCVCESRVCFSRFWQFVRNIFWWGTAANLLAWRMRPRLLFGLLPLLSGLGCRKTQRFVDARMCSAWHCSSSSNDGLVSNLQDGGLISDPRVRRAMQAVDRGDYAPNHPYDDRPIYLGYNATISAPHMHAHALELLADSAGKSGARVLDVGCGSGYLVAALAHLDGTNTSQVHGIDVIPELVEMSKRNTAKTEAGSTLMETERIVFVLADGWAGLPDKAPFDAIHVGAAAREVPEQLVAQLAPGGRMIIPVGADGGAQEYLQIDRGHDGELTQKNTFWRTLRSASRRKASRKGDVHKQSQQQRRTTRAQPT
eukprot:INCI5233.2.p1 GENE.INCI5233.2~~INCI5233.2.p1  ORF type:complete len:313 (+),score=35.97 INCI5233.2:15-953(+)